MSKLLKEEELGDTPKLDPKILPDILMTQGQIEKRLRLRNKPVSLFNIYLTTGQLEFYQVCGEGDKEMTFYRVVTPELIEFRKKQKELNLWLKRA